MCLMQRVYIMKVNPSGIELCHFGYGIYVVCCLFHIRIFFILLFSAEFEM